MGITVWQLRTPVSPSASSEGQGAPRSEHPLPIETTSMPKENEAKRQSLLDTQSLSWDQLQNAVRECQQCGLAQTRTQTVFGDGDPNANLLIIGEAPGAEEDRQGLPFVGRAGQLLNEMLFAIGFKRNQVYIANTLKCRPPNNRDPKADEVQACEGFLLRQVALIQPKVILALGRIAAHNILNTDLSLSRLRGKAYVFPNTDIPVYVTYHPAYLLRSPMDKRKAWQDLKDVAQLLNP